MQPSASLAKRPSSSQRSGAISTTSRLPSPDAVAPSRSWTSPRACVWVSTLVGLLGGLGALARLAEVSDLLLELEQPVEERLRRRRAARHVDVHRDDAVHALDDVVTVSEGAARIRAGPHGHGPLGIGHLIVDALEHGRHLDVDRAGDDHEVRVARRGKGHHPEALDVETRGERHHHLDGAASEAERHGPDRGLPRPVEESVGHRGHDETTREIEDAVFDGLEERRVLVALGPRLVELLPLLEVLELGPDGGRNLRDRSFYFHSRMPSRSAYTQPRPRMPTKSAITPTPPIPSPRSTSAQGKRKTASASKTMKIRATR